MEVSSRVSKRQRDKTKRPRGLRRKKMARNPVTDNIVVLRLPQGQTKLEKKERGNEA